MDEAAIERMAEKIKSSGRRRRPGGRWSNPASPLQAARFEARKTGKQVVAEIRQICPGHGGEPCKIDVSKVSDYETLNRRPAVDHIEAFCRLYQRSPEQLGLIKWRDDPETSGDATRNCSDSNGLHGPDGEFWEIPASTELARLAEHAKTFDASMHQLLVHLLSETAALTAATTKLLQATLCSGDATEGHSGPGHSGPSVML